jgi:hypothetical protein
LIKGIKFEALTGNPSSSCPNCNNQSDYTFVGMDVASVPLPAAPVLFASGLLGLVALRRKYQA